MLWGWFLAVTTLFVAKCIKYHLTKVKMKVSVRPSPSGSSPSRIKDSRHHGNLRFPYDPEALGLLYL